MKAVRSKWEKGQRGNRQTRREKNMRLWKREGVRERLRGIYENGGIYVNNDGEGRKSVRRK